MIQSIITQLKTSIIILPSINLMLKRRHVYGAVIAGIMLASLWEKLKILYILMSNNEANINVSTIPYLETRDSIRTKFRLKNTKSDIAYLDHCNLDGISKEDFFTWLHTVIDEWEIESFASINNDRKADVKDEVTLQGLEIYAKASRLCNYSNYKPSLTQSMEKNIADAKNVLMKVPNAPDQYARIAFIISVFSDIDNLTELLESIHLPHHLIIIHLERRSSSVFVEKVQKAATNYGNVVILQFGSILYPSDTISYINLQIMRWLIDDLEGRLFDYVILLGESAYPLWGSKEMAVFLKNETPRVRLGELQHWNGTQLCFNQANTMRLLYTRGIGEKYAMVGLSDLLASVPALNATAKDSLVFLPRTELQSKCTLKSTSGNTAAYDYATVKTLPHSTDAMEWLSHFKYVDGCCMVESSWAGAMEIIGKREEVMMPGAFWQAWPCSRGEMHNSILTAGDSTCFDIHHYPAEFRIEGEYALLEELKGAKKRGVLFCRKFDSSVNESVAFRKLIHQHLHR